MGSYMLLETTRMSKKDEKGDNGREKPGIEDRGRQT